MRPEPLDVYELTCQELVELVTDYIEGVLSAQDKTRFEHHLSECPGCNAYLSQMRKTIQVIGRLTEEHIEEQAKEQLLAVFQDWKRNRGK
jgi:anti-sigma factor RsiW